jgi:hypothetical protein
MFHFPAFPPHTLYIQVRVTAHDDCRVSPFGHPRITARLTAPRGLSRPPTSFIGSWCLGIHRAPLLTWPQMLASTVQFSNNNRKYQRSADACPNFSGWFIRPVETGGPRGDKPQPPPPRLATGVGVHSLRTQQRARQATRWSDPFHAPRRKQYWGRPPEATCRIVNVPPLSTTQETNVPGVACLDDPPSTLWWSVERLVLLRKEVIQPHLPVRLPCYDFVPIAGPTFDGSPSCELGHRLRVLPTFVT